MIGGRELHIDELAERIELELAFELIDQTAAAIAPENQADEPALLGVLRKPTGKSVSVFAEGQKLAGAAEQVNHCHTLRDQPSPERNSRGLLSSDLVGDEEAPPMAEITTRGADGVEVAHQLEHRFVGRGSFSVRTHSIRARA